MYGVLRMVCFIWCAVYGVLCMQVNSVIQGCPIAADVICDVFSFDIASIMFRSANRKEDKIQLNRLYLVKCV